ncbi:MAG: arginase family protein [Chitinophagaceae bacterium]|nr:arginase family protein [Chitinophagaceae bacterium]
MVTYFDKEIRNRQFEGETQINCRRNCKQTTDKVYISFDIDGLDRKLCPFTGTPVPGGLGTGAGLLSVHQIAAKRKNHCSFDLNEVEHWW